MAKRGAPKKEIILTKQERDNLEALVLLDNTEQKVKNRIKMILMSAAGQNNREISEELNCTSWVVSKWRQRFLHKRIAGLNDQPRSGRKPVPIELTEDEHGILKNWTTSRSLPHSLVIRASIILLATSKKSNPEIANSLNITTSTVRKWKRNFINFRINGLHDEYRSGRPRTYSEEQIAELIYKTMNTKPKNATHWSCRELEKETGISRSTVSKILNLFCLKPHKQDHFKLSNDPFFVDKVIDVVGLYLSPPRKCHCPLCG